MKEASRDIEEDSLGIHLKCPCCKEGTDSIKKEGRVDGWQEVV
jgi:hypothetical protein